MVVDIIDINDSPVWFAVAVALGAALGDLFYVIVWHDKVSIKTGFERVYDAILSGETKILLSMAPFFYYPLFIIVMGLIDTAPAVLIFEMSTLVFALLASGLIDEDQQQFYSKEALHKQVLLNSVLSIIGCGVVILTLTTIAITLDGTPDVDKMIGGILIGATLLKIAAFSWRWANQLIFSMDARSIGMHSLSYFQPLITLALLAIVGSTSVQHFDYLIIGAIAILVANIMNKVENIGLAFQGTVVTLWFSSMYVYNRHDWVETFSWHGPYYWEILGFLTTVLTLILAFRMQRVITIISNEENRYFKLVEDADILRQRHLLYVRPEHDVEAEEEYNLAWAKVVNKDDHLWQEIWHDYNLKFQDKSIEALRSRMDRIDTPKGSQLKEAYDDISIPLWHARNRIDITKDEQDSIANFQVDLNIFVTSKRHEWGFGEFFVAVLFTVVTCSIALFSFPQASGVVGMVTDVVAVLICTGFSFLIFNLLELQTIRVTPWLVPLTTSSLSSQKELNKPRLHRLVSLSALMMLGCLGVWFIILSNPTVEDTGNGVSTSVFLLSILLAIIGAFLQGSESFRFSWVKESIDKESIDKSLPTQEVIDDTIGGDSLDDGRTYRLNFISIVFQVAGTRSTQRWCWFMVVGMAVSFGYLFYDKWLG